MTGLETVMQFWRSDPPEIGIAGTEMVPTVTSWNAAGNCAFSGYRTKSACPWRPYFWLTSAMMPAKAGAEADVPPTPKICTGPLVGLAVSIRRSTRRSSCSWVRRQRRARRQECRGPVGRNSGAGLPRRFRIAGVAPYRSRSVVIACGAKGRATGSAAAGADGGRAIVVVVIRCVQPKLTVVPGLLGNWCQQRNVGRVAARGIPVRGKTGERQALIAAAVVEVGAAHGDVVRRGGKPADAGASSRLHCIRIVTTS